MACSSNSIRYNTTLCACPPGYLLNRTTNDCALFSADAAIFTDAGIDYYSFSFPETIFSFDSIKKFTQSQAVFLEATLVLLFSWLAFCLFMRFMKLGDGNNIWFQIRWWISRLDISFATRHWLDDQKVVVKRKTELGGTFSIASWILFIGLFAALLYQIISKRSIEVHNVRATNAPDLASFINEIEFNITTISSMSCANLRGLGSLVTGNPGFIDHRVFPLSNFVNYSCHNTSKGPTVNLKCHECRLTQDDVYISWQFVDLPNNPATAVGFEFNLTARNPDNKKHLSFVSGILKNGSIFNDTPVTFRGQDANILKFNLFPQLYHNLHDLRLIQPLLHEFLPGSSFHETSQLQASLASSTDGLINTTLYINFLSAYIVEIDNQSLMGPVSFLADLGGLYCISIGFFFYFLVQCEYRIKKLRNEDSVLRKIRSRRKARERWDKLRKYVKYTWNCSKLDDHYNSTEIGPGCCFKTQTERRNGSSRKHQQIRQDSISFNKKVSSEKPLKQEVISSTNNGKQSSVTLFEGNASQPQAIAPAIDDIIPTPPSLEWKAGSKLDISDIQKNLQSLYEYNFMLREKLVATQSLLQSIATNPSSSAIPGPTQHIEVTQARK